MVGLSDPNVSTDNPYLAAALEAHAAGFSVLPPEEDGSKRPLAGAWKRFQSRRADAALIRDWYSKGRTGVGAVMGDVSAHTELFEFDDAGVFIKFMEVARAAGLGPLVERIKNGLSDRTPGFGIHWYYRCAAVGGSKKLAKRRIPADEGGGWKVLIETKGSGGYAIMAPSGGRVHPSGGAYERIAGSFATITTITPAERAALHRLALTFDESGVDEHERPNRLPHPANTDGSRPGDVFITRTTWSDVLTPAGWTALHTQDNVTYWRRPGKDRGISATTNYAGSDLLYVFSTSTDFEAERGYNRFSAYAVLQHGGDYATAAKTLRLEGYEGAPARPILDDLPAHASAPAAADDPPRPEPGAYELIDIVDYKNRPRPRWLVEDVLQEDTFVCVYGPPGSYKTFFVLDLALSFAMGRPFQGKRSQQGKVLYILAEGQGGFGMRVVAWELGRTADLPRDTVRVIDQAVALHDIESVSKMVDAANQLDFAPAVIVFDTLSQNLVGADENSSEAMTNAVNAANKLRKRFGCIVIFVHHGRKSDGALRGHGSLLGALNTVLRLTTNDEAEARGADRTVQVWIEKQKDGEQQSTLFHLRPRIIDLPAAPHDDLPEDEIVVPAATSSVVLDRVSDAEEAALQAQVGERRKPAQLKGWARDFALVLYQSVGRLGATNAEWQAAASRARIYEPEKNRHRYLDARAALLRDRFVRTEQRAGVDWYYGTDALERRLRKDGLITGSLP